MYYRPISDLHVEFDRLMINRRGNRLPKIEEYTPSVLDTDDNTVLGIAGDISSKNDTARYLLTLAGRFKAVVAVLGNHDYWKRNLGRQATEIKDILKSAGCTNVHLLHRDSVVIDGVRFIGATLWTDFNQCDPLLMLSAQNTMKDYKHIRMNSYVRKVKPIDILAENKLDSDFIFSFANNEEKMVVLSHHAPSFSSIDVQMFGCKTDSCLYASNYGERVAYSNFKLWHHGHTHNSSRYQIYETDVICNPRGYRSFLVNEKFDDTILIDLDK